MLTEYTVGQLSEVSIVSIRVDTATECSELVIVCDLEQQLTLTPVHVRLNCTRTIINIALSLTLEIFDPLLERNCVL